MMKTPVIPAIFGNTRYEGECFNRESINKLIIFWIPAFAGMTLLLAGCQTVPSQSSAKGESNKEVISALGSVTEGLTNQKVSDKDLKNLAIQIQKDPQAKSALESINQALSVQQTGIKYCPVNGKRYSHRFKVCPVHGVELKNVE